MEVKDEVDQSQVGKIIKSEQIKLFPSLATKLQNFYAGSNWISKISTLVTDKSSTTKLTQLKEFFLVFYLHQNRIF